MNGVQNVLVYIRESKLSVITKPEDANHYWAFNSRRGVFYIDPTTAPGWGSKIVSAAGLTGYTDVPHVEEETITADMILFRLDPAE